VDVLTVEEMLLYTAELKRPLKESRSLKVAAMNALIEDLGLDTCRNTRIGNPLHRGISGGQVRSPSLLPCAGRSASVRPACLNSPWLGISNARR
jgi:ABC-type multidrug transport system ATPase subunit